VTIAFDFFLQRAELYSWLPFGPGPWSSLIWLGFQMPGALIPMLVCSSCWPAEILTVLSVPGVMSVFAEIVFFITMEFSNAGSSVDEHFWPVVCAGGGWPRDGWHSPQQIFVASDRCRMRL
jgi:hypothetical protein